MKVGHIAIDLGAGSGRVILGGLAEGRLWMHEVHRFSHAPLPTPAGLCWDFTGLWREVLRGLSAAAAHARAQGASIASIGVDAWGVDWGLVSAGGTLLGLPRCYRDPAFKQAFERAKAVAGEEAIYHATGIQLMQINTLYQVLAELDRDPARFADAQLLFMPDLFHWLLTGRRTVEATIASTSQMLDVRTGTWARPLLEALRIPTAMLAEPIAPGARIGPILPQIARETGLDEETLVIAPPSHDTAAAVAAVPAEMEKPWAYLSSGTWSLLGAELPEPCISAASFRANFTNELGVGGTVRFLKNISGLWLVQECRRCLEKTHRTFEFPELAALAEQAAPFQTLVSANDPAFLSPPNMIEAIQSFAKKTGQPPPESPGELVRCCLESLALEYARTLRTLESLTGQRVQVLHIVGGGSKNDLLNQFAADACGVSVLAGPDEATAMGNLLVQAMGMGTVRDLAEVRAIVRRTHVPRAFSPRDSARWLEAADRYAALGTCSEPG